MSTLISHSDAIFYYSAQSKAKATPVILGVDEAGKRSQGASAGSGTSRTRPPVAMRGTCVEVAVGKVVDAGTQELERPFIQLVVVGCGGLAIGPK